MCRLVILIVLLQNMAFRSIGRWAALECLQLKIISLFH